MTSNMTPGKQVAAAFVTYNPDETLLRKALVSMTTQIGAVYVVDNGSDDATAIADICAGLSCRFVPLGSNLGIAAAYNRAFDLAHDAGCAWVVTCDQDSIMPDGMVDKLFSAATEFERPDKLGIVCPNFVNRTTSRREYSYDTPTEIDKCISSGSMTSVAAWEAVGGFDEAMFIDAVDFDFCYRLRDAGYTVLLVPNVCIEHEIGDVRVHRFLGHEFLVLNHSAFRKFYIAQNIVYVSGKYHGGHVQPVAYLKVLKQLFLVLLYENDKAEKLSSIMHGASRGRVLLLNRAGRRGARDEIAKEGQS